MRLPCVPPLIPMSVDLPSRSHLGLELEEAGCSAALQALSSLCSGLSSSRDQRRTAIDQLHEKHRRIAKFAQAAVSGKPCSQAFSTYAHSPFNFVYCKTEQWDEDEASE